MSLWARKGLTGDSLMIVGSCIKYTAAGGEWGRVHAVWVLGGGGRTWASLSGVCKESPDWVFGWWGQEGIINWMLRRRQTYWTFSVSKNQHHSAHLFNKHSACLAREWTSKNLLWILVVNPNPVSGTRMTFKFMATALISFRVTRRHNLPLIRWIPSLMRNKVC